MKSRLCISRPKNLDGRDGLVYLKEKILVDCALVVSPLMKISTASGPLIEPQRLSGMR